MLKNVLKIIFSVGLFSYLVYQGKIDTKILSKLLLTPGTMAITLFLIISQNLSNSLRWFNILATQTTKKINFIFLAGVNWIGLFFNTVLPGAVTGDLIKMFYIKQIDSKISKTGMILTVLMDRIYGLLGLIILMGIISLSRYERLTSLGQGLETIVHFNLLLFLGAIFFFALMFLPKKLQEKFSQICSKIPVIGKKTIHLNECFWMMAEKKRTMFACIGISLFSHNLGILAFYHITSPFFNKPIAFLDLYSVIPVGMIITAIPISPGGMGVGHAAFEKILGYFQLTNGANLFNTFWIMLLINNLLGFIPYILLSKKKEKINKNIQLESN
jgi:glycosyltransferase 2 family protein